MKLSLNKTLEELENDNWGSTPENTTGLVRTIHELRRKPLKDFTVEDLRITIGQNFSLELLIPLAIDQLKQNILAEGNYYEGDLLQNVLSAEINFWKSHHDNWVLIKTLFENNRHLFDEKEHRQILKSFKSFEQIHHVND